MLYNVWQITDPSIHCGVEPFASMLLATNYFLGSIHSNSIAIVKNVLEEVQCDQIRLFLKALMAHVLTKVAQFFGYFLG